MGWWDSFKGWLNRPVRDPDKPNALGRGNNWWDKPAKDILNTDEELAARNAARGSTTPPGFGAKATTVLAPWAAAARYSGEPGRAASQRLAPAPFDPTTASPSMQRYFRSVGWDTPEEEQAPEPGFKHEEGTTGWFGPHSYKLTPWQQEQAELNYGIEAPDNSPILSGGKYKSGRLTQETYDTLGEHQQRALKFNDLLLRAVQEDRRLRPSDEDRSEYDAKVAEMFGTQGGSDLYAPTTVRLLENLDLDLRGQDLDEYLSLDRAYTDREIASLQPWETIPELKRSGKFGDDRSMQTAGILDIQQVEAAGAMLDKVMSWDEDSRMAAALGMPRPAIEEIPFGWLTEGESRGDPLLDRKEQFFKESYNLLSSRQTETLDDFWMATDELQFTDADYEELFNYFYVMSKELDRAGATGPESRTGAELREFVGLGD
jgi:hypothetical protein